MNAKKLTAGCLAALVAVESLLGVISPAYAGTAYSQMTADHKNVLSVNPVLCQMPAYLKLPVPLSRIWRLHFIRLTKLHLI